MTVMDLSDVVLSLASHSAVTVTRYASSDYLEGKIQEAEPLEGDAGSFQIQASVQPAKGRDMAVLPEGKQTDEILAVFTTVELFPVGGLHGADVLDIDGSTWEVHKVERWGSLGNYWRVLVVRIEREGT